MVDLIHVLVADDNPLATAGVTLALRNLPGVRLAGVAVDEDQVTGMITAAVPDAVIVDPRHMVADPAAFVRRLAAACPSMRIVILTAYVSDGERMELRAAGARTVVLKEIDRHSISKALFD